MPTIDDAFLTHLLTSSPSLNSLHLRSSTLGLRSGPLPLLRSMPSFLYPRRESSLDPPSPEGGRWLANDMSDLLVSPLLGASLSLVLPLWRRTPSTTRDETRTTRTRPSRLRNRSQAVSCTRHPRLLPLPFLPRSPVRLTRANCTRFRRLEPPFTARAPISFVSHVWPSHRCLSRSLTFPAFFSAQPRRNSPSPTRRASMRPDRDRDPPTVVDRR